MHIPSLFAVVETVLVVLATTSVALPAPPDSDASKPPGCIVPLVLFYSLDYPFTLVVQNPSLPEVNRGTVTFHSLDTQNELYEAVINTGEVLTNLTFTDGYLHMKSVRTGQGPSRIPAMHTASSLLSPRHSWAADRRFRAATGG